MTTAVAEIRVWPRRRQWGVVILLLAAQAGLIFWLGDRSPIVPRSAVTTPVVALAPELSSEWLAWHDPTLFVWANRYGFSGAAWSKIPQVNFRVKDWIEPPRWLPLPVAGLGNALQRFVKTNLAPPVQVADKLESRFSPLELSLPATSIAARSSLRVTGELVGRRLLSEIDLPSWPYTDLLASSVVQIAVDADGRVVSSALCSGSGSKEADQYALALARTARFNSLRESGTDQPAKRGAAWSWGQLIFEWHTVPMPAASATGTPSTNP